MLGSLPPEVVLTILAFVPLRQLQRCLLVSKSWNTLVHMNESSIYHAAAILHDFIPAHVYLSDIDVAHVPWIDHINTWKELCIKFYRMERRWEGHGRAKIGVLTPPGEAVWRFKIDEEQRTVITTQSDGGLKVSSIDEPTVLWALPHSEVHAFAHCEYSDGFLVLTREGDTLEVWRRTRDARTSPRPVTAEPDAIQRRAQGLACQSALSVSQNDRGAFTPWTAILPPNPVHALRLVHSTLLVASTLAQEAYLYDVPSGRLKRIISFRIPGSFNPPYQVNYVELGSRHIFVCTTHDLLVLPIDASDSQTSLQFPGQVQGFQEHYETQAFRVRYGLHLPIYSGIRSRSTLVECALDQSPRRPLPEHLRDFQAVHVSPCGSHFVVVDAEGCLCFVRNFEQALRNGVSILENTTILDMRQPILNLAFEEDKRIVVFVQQRGIFVVPVLQNNASVYTLNMQLQGHPRVFHLEHFSIRNTIRWCSCLQLTRFGIWFSSKPRNTDPLAERRQLNFIDFSEES